MHFLTGTVSDKTIASERGYTNDFNSTANQVPSHRYCLVLPQAAYPTNRLALNTWIPLWFKNVHVVRCCEVEPVQTQFTEQLGWQNDTDPNAPTPVLISRTEIFLSEMNLSMLDLRCASTWSPSILWNRMPLRLRKTVIKSRFRVQQEKTILNACLLVTSNHPGFGFYLLVSIDFSVRSFKSVSILEETPVLLKYPSVSVTMLGDNSWLCDLGSDSIMA